jgi:hypothetical protein
LATTLLLALVSSPRAEARHVLTAIFTQNGTASFPYGPRTTLEYKSVAAVCASGAQAGAPKDTWDASPTCYGKTSRERWEQLPREQPRER